MAEYIERESLLREIERRKALMVGDKLVSVDAMKSFIKNRPAADVSQVRHGEWLRADDDWNSLTTIQCSLCNEEWCFETDDDVSLLNYKYCPNCGAKMDKHNESEN